MTEENEVKTPKRKTKRRVVPDGEARQRIMRRASVEARQLAGVILQVLAGELGTAEAAAALGKSSPQYYKLENRALEGLLQGCEPRPRGRQRDPTQELAQLKQTNARLERECARLQSLVRLLGKTSPSGQKKVASSSKPGKPPAKKSKPKAKKGKSSGRKRTVRALRLASQMTENVSTDAPPGPAPPARPRVPDGEGTGATK